MPGVSLATIPPTIDCVALVLKVTVAVATPPLPLTLMVPDAFNGRPLSKKSTVPVGVPADSGLAVTVAVNVTDDPSGADGWEDMTVLVTLVAPTGVGARAAPLNVSLAGAVASTVTVPVPATVS